MTPLKYVLAIFAPMSRYASMFLTFLLPTVSYWIFLIGVVCWIPMLIFTLTALFRRRWKALAIFSAAWLVVALPSIGITEPLYWVGVLSFRIHALPMGEYLSRCELIAFVENDAKQQVGRCESVALTGDAWIEVFYDTTGQFALPPARRTQGWKDAMFPKWFLIETAIGSPIFENFYAVIVPLNKVEES